MSDTSTPLGSLFESQRTLIDRSIDTQEKLDKQGLDLTKQAVTPLVGVAAGVEDDAEARLDDVFEQLEDTQADLFADLQEAAERGVDTSEEVTERSVEFVEKLRDAARDVEADAEDTAEAIDVDIEDAAEDVTDAAEDVAKDLGDGVEAATSDVEDAAEDIEDDVEDAAEAVEGTAHDETASGADVKGIGKTYAARLEAAGIETPGDLATTGAAEVAEAAGVSEDRASEWIQQAQTGA